MAFLQADLLPFSDKDPNEVYHWCWVLRPRSCTSRTGWPELWATTPCDLVTLYFTLWFGHIEFMLRGKDKTGGVHIHLTNKGLSKAVHLTPFWGHAIRVAAVSPLHGIALITTWSSPEIANQQSEAQGDYRFTAYVGVFSYSALLVF